MRDQSKSGGVSVHEQKPTIGRMVHYTNLGDKDGRFPPEVQAATVVGVYKEMLFSSEDGKTGSGIDHANKVGDIPDSMYVDLKVHYRTGDFYMNRVPFTAIPQRGHWNWPPKV